jgi:HEPN domain-containing protein
MQEENSTIQYWLELSRYDLKVAHSMFEKGHYLYVGFMCHQAVEKLLKAVYVKKYNKMPPFIHKLDKLIELGGLKKILSEDNYDLMDELSPLNIQARYPAYKETIYKLITKDKAEEVLSKTGDFIEWLKVQSKLTESSECL